jgi:hypothetical protein
MCQQGRGEDEYVKDQIPRAAKLVLLSFQLWLIGLI